MVLLKDQLIIVFLSIIKKDLTIDKKHLTAEILIST